MKKIDFKKHKWFDSTWFIILIITLFGFYTSFIGLIFAIPFIIFHYIKYNKNKKSLKEITNLETVYDNHILELTKIENDIKNKETIFESAKEKYKSELFKSYADELAKIKNKIDLGINEIKILEINKEKRKEEITKELFKSHVDELATLKNTIDFRTNEIKKLETNKDKRKEEITKELSKTYEDELATLKNTIDLRTNEIKILEINKDKNEKEMTQKIFKSHEDELTTLKNTIDLHTNDIKNLEINKDKREKEITQKATDNLITILEDVETYSSEKESLITETEKLRKQVVRHTNIIKRAKYEIQSLKRFNENFPKALNTSILSHEVDKIFEVFDNDSIFQSIVDLDLHHKDSKELRRQMNAKKKILKKLLESYSSNYTTKTNRAIYSLMTIGIQAELQNILYSLTFSKIDDAKENINQITREYLTIAGNGNRTILPTISRFLTELEPLMLDMIEIEYTYYHKREQEQEEQRAIREQMRQDAAERRLLKIEQKKIEAEETKFEVELDRHKELLDLEIDQTEIELLQEKIRKLESQQKQLSVEKEDIISRANGKAGYVYIISNLGSFGENMFKIGMTRRMEPFDRITELSSASVPYKFDVHAMIFSKDAVGLENKLHGILDGKRVNKVNMRKEFFNTSINELEEIVIDIDSTVDFKTTLIAREYKESMEIVNKQKVIF